MPGESFDHKPMPNSRFDIGALDLHLFHEGTHQTAYEVLGAHPGVFGGVSGTRFAVWAPNASAVAVVGDWNGWNADSTPLARVDDSGVWAGVVREARAGMLYKLAVRAADGSLALKCDPYAFEQEHLPGTASRIHTPGHVWSSADSAWLARRAEHNAIDKPMSIYEVHLGSWQRGPNDERLSYRAIAPKLAAHASGLGFTHVELMPVMEHPFGGSWGYQVTGYYAPTSRFGSPDDFAFFVDCMHAHGLGVILDWPPAHFATDGHGLGRFDGTCLYEHADPRQGHHPEWTSHVFNFGRNEVRSFLISNALFWIERFHVDGLRVDGVASMLYLDYARKAGEWIPNVHGGRENLEAVSLLRALNGVVQTRAAGAQIIAEESTAWPKVTGPLDEGGLGFGLKWDLGWMHDTLRYLSRDPVHRKFHHRELTFRGLYAFQERFILPLSHDEVVHGKGSLLRKMAGADAWQKRANLRLLLAYLYASPGKKLLFMGSELASWDEWDEASVLPFHLLDRPEHAGIALLVSDLNRLYRSQPALYTHDTDPAGLCWLDADNEEQSVIAIERRGAGVPPVVAVFNFTPVPRFGFRVGVHQAGPYRELLNSDATSYGGSDVGNLGHAHAVPEGYRGLPCALDLVLPPLGAVFLTPG